MENGRIKLVVLGAGPAGLALAMKWLQRPSLKADVVVLEKADQVGGLAAGFEQEGLIFDYGSHRLHPSTSPEILTELHNLLAGDLLDQPRYGRIRLFDRFVQFPLKPLELVRKLPPAFVAGFLRDSLVKLSEPEGAGLLRGRSKTGWEKPFVNRSIFLCGKTVGTAAGANRRRAGVAPIGNQQHGKWRPRSCTRCRQKRPGAGRTIRQGIRPDQPGTAQRCNSWADRCAHVQINASKSKPMGAGFCINRANMSAGGYAFSLFADGLTS